MPSSLRLAFSHVSHRCERANVPDEERRGLEEELLAASEALRHVAQVPELRVGLAYLCMHTHVYLHVCVQMYSSRALASSLINVVPSRPFPLPTICIDLPWPCSRQ